jgi:Fe-S oxidoreductase/FAD/FMN-containing dehydrogenase
VFPAAVDGNPADRNPADGNPATEGTSETEMLTDEQEVWLRERFGGRVSTDLMERKIYSHDVGEMPPLVQPLIGKALAWAVVQPKDEEEVSALARWADANRIPLIPRGKATSGYGGVIPVKGGITVDMWRMRDIVSIDEGAETVTVQPALVWQDLEQALGKHGLALRLYPSSAPSSTVGGWLAQGGFGYGSYEYNSFSSNVVSARVVLPSGEVREFIAADADGNPDADRNPADGNPADENPGTSEDSIDLIADAEGITGIISEITLRVRSLEEDTVVGYAFAGPATLGSALTEIVARGLPLWSASFINAQMAAFKNRLPPEMEHNQPVPQEGPGGGESVLPEAYIAIFAYPDSRGEAVSAALEEIAAQHSAQRLPDALIQREWEERFQIMHVKRLGPSLIPTELVLPLGNLGTALTDIENRIHQPLLFEGIVVGSEGAKADGTPKADKNPQAVLLGFIPHDIRTPAFNVAFGLALSAVVRAKRHGGRVYASGLYFAQEAESVLGAERLRRLRTFKHEVDPKGIMNPGKILDRSLLTAFMGTATAFEPLVRVAANLATAPRVERADKNPADKNPADKNPADAVTDADRARGAGRRGIPDDVAWYAQTCAQCGFCVGECDQFYGRGWESESPRAKWFFLREYMAGRAEFEPDWTRKFLACTTCEVCNVKCPLGLPNEPSWLEMRGELVQERGELTLPAFEVMRAALNKERDIWAGYSGDRAAWLPEDLAAKIPERAPIAYFAGCTASFVEHDVAQATARLLDAAGVEYTYMGTEEACCGLPMLAAGIWDTFGEIVQHNIEGMQRRGVKTIVTSCPACWLSWAVYYPRWAKKLGLDYPFEAKHYTQLLAEKIEAGELEFTNPVDMKVTWHDPCHMGRAGGIYEPPRQVIQAIPGIQFVEMEYNREQAHCCGGVITLVDDPDTGKIVGDVRVREAEATGAEAIVASCPCCEVQLRVTIEKTGRDMPVIDLGHLAAEGLGIELPDPTTYALEQWATFEAMIRLLKPEAMADLMVELFPPMVDAMPWGLGGIMRRMGSAGPAGAGALRAIKPAFPLLFPLLMPRMMPALMPRMLDAVGKRVPMSDEMKEQMPELMPEAMARLMPKMLPSIVPLISDRLIAYLSKAPRSQV